MSCPYLLSQVVKLLKSVDYYHDYWLYDQRRAKQEVTKSNILIDGLIWIQEGKHTKQGNKKGNHAFGRNINIGFR